METKLFEKYPGFTVNFKMNFGKKIAHTTDKAAESVTALSRLMTNDSGPKSSKHHMLMSVV